MHSTTTRLLAGFALSGAFLVGAGAPALAAMHPSGHRAQTRTALSTRTAPTVRIGTAVQWVHEPDGSVRQIILH